MKSSGESARRGTTHFSVIDAQGNVASMTVSNGEGCGSIVPHTGVMLNNMLGEQDLNVGGFHLWTENQRMTSMMAPSLIQTAGGHLVATGSGGSNRIRTALLQVIMNLTEFDMDVTRAVTRPRIHLEGTKLSAEGGFSSTQIDRLMADYPDHELWAERNLFFGGAHTVMAGEAEFAGVGDPRRRGCLSRGGMTRQEQRSRPFVPLPPALHRPASPLGTEKLGVIRGRGVYFGRRTVTIQFRPHPATPEGALLRAFPNCQMDAAFVGRACPASRRVSVTA